MWMEYLKQAWSKLQFCAEQYLPASPSQSQGWGVERARVGADTTAFVCLCLQGYVCVCVGVGRWRVLGVGKGVCVWWGKGDSKAFQEHESLETSGWSWVQALAPAFQREIRSMVIRHLPLRQMGKEFAFLKTPACRDENQEETAGFPATPHPHPQGSWGPWWEVAFPWASVASATHCWFEHPGLFLRELFFTHLFEWFITKKSHSIREHWKLPWLSEEKWQREAGRQNRDVSFYLKEISMELKITENLKVCFTRMVAVL